MSNLIPTQLSKHYNTTQLKDFSYYDNTVFQQEFDIKKYQQNDSNDLEELLQTQIFEQTPSKSITCFTENTRKLK